MYSVSDKRWCWEFVGVMTLFSIESLKALQEQGAEHADDNELENLFKEKTLLTCPLGE